MNDITNEFLVSLNESTIGVDSSASYAERISQKGVMENDLWGRIMPVVPWDIKLSKMKEDIMGVDAKYSSLKNGTNVTPKTIQLKFRQTGNDILMETILGWQGVNSLDEIRWTGRDVRWEVDLYFCIDTKFQLRVVSADYLKSVAKDMTNQFVLKYLVDRKIKMVRTSYGDVRIKREESDKASLNVAKVDKILVFIEPRKILNKVLYEFKI